MSRSAAVLLVIGLLVMTVQADVCSIGPPCVYSTHCSFSLLCCATCKDK